MRRPERVADMLREEIAQIVGFELTDPRLTMVTVTDVRLTDNLRDAKVFVTVVGTEDEIKEAMKALRHASPYIRKQVGFALSLRHTPEIHFLRDIVEEKGARVDELLLEIERNRQSTGAQPEVPENRKDEGEV